MMFEGFDFFGPSLIATLLHIIPILAIVIPAYFLFYVSMFVSMAAAQGSGGEPNPAAFLGVMATFGLFWVVVMVVIVIISIGFTFAYPLIADRKMQGLDAVKLSFRAALANFGRVLGMMLITSLMTIVGAVAWLVG